MGFSVDRYTLAETEIRLGRQTPALLRWGF